MLTSNNYYDIKISTLSIAKTWRSFCLFTESLNYYISFPIQTSKTQNLLRPYLQNISQIFLIRKINTVKYSKSILLNSKQEFLCQQQSDFSLYFFERFISMLSQHHFVFPAKILKTVWVTGILSKCCWKDIGIFNQDRTLLN